MASLQTRFILGGMVWAVSITIVGTFALLAAFDQISNRRFDSALLERHTQLVVGLERVGSPEQLAQTAFDPAYERPYSGRYWQIETETGDIQTSPSLFDWEIDVPPNESGLNVFTTQGPNFQIRALAQTITFQDGEKYTIVVAESTQSLLVERNTMRRNIAFGFGLVGLIGLFGIVILFSLLLVPLKQLQKDIAHRWESEKGLVPEEYPKEVAPLVEDINELSRRNKTIIQQGRRKAADLAHVLKTPSAAARNELVELSKRVEGTDRMFEALDRIDAQITRSLAKMRASNSSNEVNIRTDVHASLQRLDRLFSSISKYEDRDLTLECPAGISAAIDKQDFEEICGNIIDNALAWCEKRTVIRAMPQNKNINLTIEDDGPGIPADQYQTVLQEGQRLDSKVPGTGLGLSIANDLVLTYGGQLQLGRSGELGGLLVSVSLPSANS